MVCLLRHSTHNPGDKPAARPDRAAHPAVPHVTMVSRATLRRRFVLGFVIALAAVALHHSRLAETLQDVRSLQQAADAWGPVAPFLAVGVSSLWIGIGLPRMPVSGVAGLLFGAPIGFCVAHTSVLLGNALMLAILRRFGREWRLWRRLERKAIQKGAVRHGNGLMDVLIIRLIPVTAVLQNIPLVALRPRTGALWLGTLLGALPGTLVAVALGAGLAEDSLHDSVALASLAIVLLALTSWGIRWLVERRQSAD